MVKLDQGQGRSEEACLGLGRLKEGSLLQCLHRFLPSGGGKAPGGGSMLLLVGWVPLLSEWASLVAQTVKNLPAMQETQVQSLGQEDPLEKGMATHCSILAWRIPWTEDPGGLQSMGLQRVRYD